MQIKIRIDYFDIAKGISILAVILGHCKGLPLEIINFVFTFHMPLFFIISGDFIKERNTKEMIALKAKQLLIPYVVTAGTVIVSSALWLKFNGAHIDVIYSDILRRSWAVFYGSGHTYETPIYILNAQALWFFPALFFASIILNWCIKQKYSYFFVGIIAAAGYFSSKVMWLPFSVQAGMLSVLYMYVGYLLKKYNILTYLQNKIVVLEVFTLFILYYIWGGGKLYLVRNWIGQGLWEIIGSIFAVLCVIKISQIISERTNIIKSGLVFLGKNTLYILCFHILDLSLFKWDVISTNVGQYGEAAVLSLLFLCRTFWAVGAAIIFVTIKGLCKRSCTFKKKLEIVESSKKRNIYLDIACGIAILSMIFAHCQINPLLRTIIFSFHMPIFILISGYFYKREEPFKTTIFKIIRTLILPYVFVSLLYAFRCAWQYVYKTDIAIVSGQEVWNIFQEKLSYMPWAISFTSTKFQDIESVGPIWFIACLIIIRVLYKGIDYTINNKKLFNTIILILCVIGYMIGQFFAYLPWSADVALTCMVFYHVGYCIKVYNVLPKLTKNLPCIIALFILWIISIHNGGLELATRRFPYFPICMIGAIAGCLLVILLCKVLEKVDILSQILSFCGKNSMLILGIHCLEQRCCAWGKMLPETSPYIIFGLRIILVFSIFFIAIAIKEIWMNIMARDGEEKSVNKILL